MDPELWELLEEGNSGDEIAAIVRLGQPSIVPKGVRVVAQFGDIATIRMERGKIQEVRSEEGVTSLKAPEPRGFGLAPDLEFDSIEPTEELSEAKPWIYERRPPSLPETGRGVVIGIVDWGFDFAHHDFRHEDGRTRILALWDQRQPPSPRSPQPYGYGIVYTAEDINHALAAEDQYGTLGCHPADADTGRGTHATHVASIAAGNGRGCGLTGVAPEADLVFVHLSTWDRTDLARLGDSVTLLEAVHFIVRTADTRPWVINLSMGRHGEQHDGTTPCEQGLDAALRAAPGGCIVQSCGNYFESRIHASGQLRPAEKRTLVWEIEDADITPNKLEVWYEGRDVFEVEIRSPDGTISTRAALGERASLTAGGRDIGTIYHRASEPNTLDNHIEIILYRGGSTGPWELTLQGKDVVDGRFHCWIERDSGCSSCQSRFRLEDSSSSYTTGTISNGLRTIAVGAYNPHSAERELAPFSSCGPTRDGRVKPDVIAPGEFILSARSAGRDPHAEVPPWTLMSGTSMAAPHVAGAVACMFQAAHRPLRIEETRNLLLSNTERVTGHDQVLERVGSGYLDIAGAVEAARRIGSSAPQLQPILKTEEDTVNRENDISSTGTWEQESPQEDGESNPLGNPDMVSFEACEPAEPGTRDAEDEEPVLYAGDELAFGRELVELADEVISAGKVHSPGALLSELLSKAGVMAQAWPLGAGHINSTSPAALFDAFTSNKHPELREYFNQLFDVVAFPKSSINGNLQSGDCCVRRALGEGNMAHVAILVTGKVIRVDNLAIMGLQSESRSPGLYAEVIEAGAFPHRQSDQYARRLSDGAGLVLPDTLLLRLLPIGRLSREADAESGYAGAAAVGLTKCAGCSLAEDVGFAEQPAPAALPSARTTTVARAGFQPDISVLCPPPPVILDQFDSDGDPPKAVHRTRLGTLAQEIVDSQTSSDPIHTLCILGHTDGVGAETHNQDLAARRATAVARELETALETRRPGLAATLGRTVESRGEEAMRVPNNSSANRARNRRVEIFLNRRWVGSTPAVGACPTVAVAVDDPTAPTPFAVGEDTFSGTIPLFGASIPVSGTVFFPANSSGSGTAFASALTTPAPLVVFAHGNHSTFRHPTDRFREHCGPGSGFVPLENHRGYDYLQRLLAGMGMVVVSVDANVTNCEGLSPTNIHLRGALILAAIQHFLNLHTGGTSRFVGKLDIARTALFGHSRGGEAVLVAAETLPTVPSLSAARVLGVLSLAPTDAGATSGRPNGFAYLAMLPAADGDVIDNDGAKYYDQATPSPFKCQIYVHGANHNFFNRNWPPDEGHGAARLSRAEHERILSAYACAFFRGLLLGHNTLRFLRVDVLPPAVPADKVLVSFEATGATTVDDHENRNISLNALGASTTQSSGLTAAEFDFQQGVLSSFNSSFFGKTVGMVAQTSAAGGLFRSQLPVGVNLTGREIWVRAAEVYNGAAVPTMGTGYQIGLEDAAGGTSFADSNDVGGLPRPFDRRADDLARVGVDRTKTMLKTQRFAAACFVRSGFDPTQVRAVLVRLDRGDSRALAFDQLQIV